MYTAKQIFDRSIAIIDELSDSGTISDSQVKEYKSRAPYLLDMFQKEMAKSGDFFKTFELVCTRKKNILGDLNQMGIIKENNGITESFSGIGANCFYLEVDGDCTISFKENNQPMTGKYSFNGGAETSFAGSINITVPAGTTSFLPIRGILNTVSPDSMITMTISGLYFFRHNNRALSDRKYKSALQVPDFKPWVRIKMPSDFKSRTQIINEHEPWQYEESNNHKWEGANELYVLFSYDGLIRIKYIPVPKEITSLDQTMEIDDISAQAGSYYLAEHFAIADQNDELARMCKSKYRELKTESMLKLPLTATEIKDIYGISRIE